MFTVEATISRNPEKRALLLDDDESIQSMVTRGGGA